MSFQQVCRAFYRHLCFESLPQSQHASCCSLSFPNTFPKSASSDNDNDNKFNQKINKIMDVLGMSDHYNCILRSNISLSKPPLVSKEKSLLIDPQRKKSTATLLSPPPSLSICLAEITTIVTTPPTSSSFVLKKANRSVPYYISCFSPLDLPSEIFICLLEFLSPADLWRLCQVSHAMQAKVIGFMSKTQRFKYSAVRILHQEHSNAVLGMAHRGSTFYDRMTCEASPSSSKILSLVRVKKASQVQSRSSYWLAQASCLVAIITEGTKFEPEFENTPVIQGACANPIHKSDSVLPSTSSSPEDSTERSPFIQPPVSETSSVSNTTSTVATPDALTTPPLLLSPISNGYPSSKSNPRWDDLEPLPMDRFNSIVDLIFDPNIVSISHRRAIINCARYVSASIDESFQKSVSTQEPVNPEFFADFQTQYTIETGPYLTALTPIRHVGDGSELLPKEQTFAGDIISKAIPPPKRLLNYFQTLLWYRCMSDLIHIYNRIRNRHVDISPRRREPQSLDTTTHTSDIYPFCCKAHSLVFTTQYPISIVPYSIRAGFRRAMRMVQSISQKSILSATVIGQSGSTRAVGRRIQPVGSSKRLNFCNGSAQPPAQTLLNHKRSTPIDDELVQRRYQIEEQTREDNQVKQELLGLCHMACGLFLIDLQSSDGPSTIMSLLRQGTPWNKGVWREGEWQHDFINQQNYAFQGSDSNPHEGSKFQSYNDPRDMGRWQKLCIATIQFLAHEDLAWGGNRANAELSRLRATSNANAWVYYE